MIGFDQSADVTTVNDMCLAQGIAQVYLENVVFMCLLVLMDVERHVLVHNDKRPAVRGPIYVTNILIPPLLLVAGGSWIWEWDRYKSAYGWNNQQRCKWYTEIVNGTTRGHNLFIVEMTFQAIIFLIVSKLAREIYTNYETQMYVCTSSYRRSAIQARFKAHRKYIWIVYANLFVKFPSLGLVIAEVYDLVYNCITKSCRAGGFTPGWFLHLIIDYSGQITGFVTLLVLLAFKHKSIANGINVLIHRVALSILMVLLWPLCCGSDRAYESAVSILNCCGMGHAKMGEFDSYQHGAVPPEVDSLTHSTQIILLYDLLRCSSHSRVHLA